MADNTPTGYLDALNWGTSTGGAAGAAETTSTLGQDRLDVTVPIDSYRFSGLQISRIKNLVLSMSDYFKGGTRLKVLTQTANPLGAAESGFYISTGGTAYSVFNGTPTAIGGGGMSIGGSITSATAGSVLFAGTAGVLAQDNTNLFWDDTNNRLGVGINTPAFVLDIKNSIGITPTANDAFLDFGAGQSAAVSAASHGRLRYNATTNKMQYSENGGAYNDFSAGTVSIGGTVTSGTTGSVLFVGSGPVLAQDNATFFWDTSTKRLGIGTTTVRQALHVHGGRLRFTNATNGAANANEIWANADDTLNMTTRGSIQTTVDSDGSAGADYFDISYGSGPTLMFRAGAGKVGINQSTPTTYSLDVISNIGITPSATDAYLELGAGQSAAVSASGKGRVRYNATTNKMQYSENNAAYVDFSTASTLAIGSTITSGTTGSILFIGASAALTQDNASLFWDDTNNRLGLLTTSPQTALHIHSNGRIRLTGTSTTAPNEIYASNDDVIQITTRGSVNMVVDSDTSGTTDAFNVYRTSTATTPLLTVFGTGNVGMGVTTPGEKLEVSGNVSIGRIGTNFSRYVGLGASGTGTITVGTSGGSQIEFTSITAGDNDIYFITHFAGVSHGRRARIDRSGFWTWTPLAQTTGSPNLWTMTAPAHTTLTASTEATDLLFSLNRTVQFATGALTTQRAVLFNNPTYAFVGASTLTTAATVAIAGAPVAGTNATITNSYALFCQGGRTRVDTQLGINASPATGVTVNLTQPVATTGSPNALLMSLGAHTTLTASTEAIDFDVAANRTVQFATGALTTQRSTLFRNPTYAFVGASTLTNAATVAILGAPVAGTNATITNSYALWVQAGKAQFDGNATVAGSGSNLGFFGSAGTTIQASGANLTNNVTAGGTNDTIADFTDLSVYANDAATIRDDIYQLARKLKQVNDALRAYGMLT